jgi:RNA polymerase sigma-70 factor (ECF subfamily)
MLADLAADPEALAEQASRRQAVRAALRRLPPAERAAVIQRYYLGLRDEQIAANQNCAPGTVRWRLHNARQRLRAWLRPLGEEDAS